MADWQLRPARDHGLSRAERLRSTVREPGLGSLVLGGVWRRLVRAYLAAAHRLRIEGRENLPAPPYVMVANHASHLDALTLAAALPRADAAHAYALAAGDTFFTTAATAAFAAYAINALPVWRGKTTARSIADLRTRLMEDGAVLMLFPEGTRTRTGVMGPFKPGIGALVAGTAVPVVPCHLEGAFQAWPPTARWPRPRPLRLVIGAPLDFSEAATTRAALNAISIRCEEAVRALGPQVG